MTTVVEILSARWANPVAQTVALTHWTLEGANGPPVTALPDVLISSISILLKLGTSDVSVYTSSGAFLDKYTDSTSWTEIFSFSYTSSETWVETEMEFTSDVSVSRGSTQSFYIYATGDVLFPLLNPTDPLTSDDNLSIVAVARGGDSGLWGDNSNEYSL
eukprot:scaffold11942_cov79-Cyclotella_meneghiniana.AAC.3